VRADLPGRTFYGTNANDVVSATGDEHDLYDAGRSDRPDHSAGGHDDDHGHDRPDGHRHRRYAVPVHNLLPLGVLADRRGLGG
jgi:hypothetical protein